MNKGCVFEIAPLLKLPSAIYDDEDVSLLVRGLYGCIATMGYYGGVGYLTAMTCGDIHPNRYKDILSALHSEGMVRYNRLSIHANPPMKEPAEYVTLACTPRQMCLDYDLSLRAKGFLYSCLYAMDFDYTLSEKLLAKFPKKWLDFIPDLKKRGLCCEHKGKLSFNPDITGTRPYGVPVDLDPEWAYDSFVQAMEKAKYVRYKVIDSETQRIYAWAHKVHWIQSPGEEPTVFWVRVLHTRKPGKNSIEYSFIPGDSDPTNPEFVRKWHKAIDWVFPHIRIGTELYKKMDAYLEGLCQVIHREEQKIANDPLDER